MKWVDNILGESTMTGSIPPLGQPSPLLRQRQLRRPPLERPKRRRSNVNRILGEADDHLIPDDAEDVKLGGSEDDEGPGDLTQPDDQHEPLLDPALALVAPDLTPNALRELDPSLVPKQDQALSTILGDPPPKSTPLRVGESLQPIGLPSEGDMPRPPGEFLKPLSSYAETSGKASDQPKVELISAPSPVGFGGEASLDSGPMPSPADPKPAKIMEAFRRFHRPMQ